MNNIEGNYVRWGRDSLYCYESCQNCEKCELNYIHGFHPNNEGLRKCHIPDAIDKLLEKGIEPKKKTLIATLVETLPINTPFKASEVFLDKPFDRLTKVRYLNIAKNNNLIELYAKPKYKKNDKIREAVFIRKKAQS